MERQQYARAGCSCDPHHCVRRFAHAYAPPRLRARLARHHPRPGRDADRALREGSGAPQSFYEDLHRNPELSGEEKRTAGKIAAELRALGLEVIENIGGYGLVGILRNGKGPTTLLRTEMDALPIVENTGLPYKSETPGKMPACGHDFHATALVGAAYVMVNSKRDWSGTIVFLAQPAEEVGKGARAMIEDGLFAKIPRPDQLLALHTSGGTKLGALVVNSGCITSNSDSIDVRGNSKMKSLCSEADGSAPPEAPSTGRRTLPAPRPTVTAEQLAEAL